MTLIRSRAAQRVVRRGSVAVGQASAGLRMRPDFLIVGAQRAGTTSLYKTLTQHPSVLPAVWHKGVHYFDTGHEHGPRWYRGHFPLQARGRRVLRSTGAIRTGEASPYYLFHPLAAERIGRELPGVAIIVALRDPVERAYSAHAHELARGFEHLPFAEAIESETARLAGEEDRIRADPAYQSRAHQHHAYLARGRYAEQLARMRQHNSRVHVVDSGELFTDPQRVIAGIVEFLRLPAWTPGTFEQRNARTRAGLDPGLRRELLGYFRSPDEELSRMLGRPPSWRR